MTYQHLGRLEFEVFWDHSEGNLQLSTGLLWVKGDQAAATKLVETA